MALVYRPDHPAANSNGMVDKELAGPLIEKHGESALVISDMKEYRAVAADVDGNAPIIGGRRQHREFLARNGYVEIGNEKMPERKQELSRSDRISDIRRAIGE